MSGSFAPNARTTKPAVHGKRGIVAAQNTKAARIGADILAAGGNAMDAAIATSLALAACEPWMSGLGGGGVCLHYDADRETCTSLDFNMRASAHLDGTAYPVVEGAGGDLFAWPAVRDNRNVTGPLAIAVPGQLAGLAVAHERFASMPFAELAAPAIALAREGLEVDWYASLVIGTAAGELHRFSASRELFLPGGFAPVPEWSGRPTHLPLTALASTLEALAAEGPARMAGGDVVRAMASDLANIGSPVAFEEMASLKVENSAPLTVRYRDARIHAMDGLFAGPTLAMAMERIQATKLGGDWPDETAFLAYADGLTHATAYRLEHMGDNPAANRNGTSECTSHFSVVDARGNMVSMTQTLLSLFGSRVLLPETGILMNNGIMWFDPRPGRANSLGPGRRPLANMCPVIAENETLRLALGASGGRRIMPAVMQILCSVLDHHMSLEEAFSQPRIDTSLMDEVVIDHRLWDPVPEALAARYTIRSQAPAPYPLSFACPSGILCDLVDGYRYGTAEASQPWADAVIEP